MEIVEPTNVYAYKLITKKDYFAPGHRACQGCAEALAVRLVAKALGRNAIVASATGCMEIISSPMPFTSWRVPWIHVAFENEGGTSDIGVQALSGALERGHDFIYICYDNEAYMNTGIQRSSSTPYGASTTTSPAGKVIPGQITWKKNMPEIAAAHNIPYVATACPSYPIDLVEKVKKAARLKGPAYVHILSVCPTGWRLPPELSIKAGRLAVETGVFPLYEVEHGRYRFTGKIEKLRPVKEYLKIQGRFRHLSEEMINTIQKRVVEEYEKLQKKVEMTEGD